MRRASVILSMFVVICVGCLFVVFRNCDLFKEKQNPSCERKMLNFESNVWGRVNGLSYAVYSSVSNITISADSDESSRHMLYALCKQFSSLQYESRSPREIRAVVSKYEELVLYLSLGLVRNQALESEVGAFILDSLDQLVGMWIYIDEKYAGDDSIYVKNCRIVVQKEIKTFIRFFETVGIRLVFDQYSEQAKEKFLQKWRKFIESKKMFLTEILGARP